jgi:secreted trypsin-like serine protease
MKQPLSILLMTLLIIPGCSNDRPESKANEPRNLSQEKGRSEEDSLLKEVDSSRSSEQKQWMASTKIYRGDKVDPSELLAVVGITKGTGRFPICTGTIIDQDIVLTAAHCICDGATSNIYIGHDPNIRTVGRGYYSIANWESGMDCVTTSPRDGLDLAILRTDKKISEAKPLPLANATATDNSRFARVVGFGAIDANGTVFPYRKMEADVPIVSADCGTVLGNEMASELFGCLPGSELVAGKRSTPDTCSGDSGGPLLVSPTGDTRSAPYIELKLGGVTSRSTKDAEKPCGMGGIYERLTPEAMNWIRQAMVQVRS